MKNREQENLYVLKHKDMDVALVYVDTHTGRIEYLIELFLPEELPVGCRAEGNSLSNWWQMRAIPDSRKGILRVLKQMEEETTQTLMLSGFGLSLTDHYWLQPIGEERYWKEINYFENDFSDELGDLLTDSGKISADAHISKFSPSSSVNGEMKKKWIIEDGKRYLLKVNVGFYGQQSVNEVIASTMHKMLNLENYVPYKLSRIWVNGQEALCSLNPLFTSADLEFVSAYQLICNDKVPNDVSEYEEMIALAVSYGMEEHVVRRQLEYTIMTDFLLSNTDRHYNNFGFLYHPAQHRLTAMAPVFDTGNCLFYNEEAVPSGKELLDLNVTSFRKREAEMLQYVKTPEWFPVEKLAELPCAVEELLGNNTGMPPERAKKIARTIAEKTEYLKLFLSGKKIWKRERFW